MGRLSRGAWLVIVLVLSAVACDEEKELTAPPSPEALSVANGPAAEGSVTAMGTIPLPINQTFNGGLAFAITQTGTGRAGLFRINSFSNASSAFDVTTIGTGPAFTRNTL